ncbi:peptide-methionine (S)-S-oxide reductase MsrA [Sporosarcina aquimarina]|uniref:peptide-methionine (S)-S-oxide reductase MsrA n=1 Tax=Sporosarcina aquimarina TaxID=114975 RepID=UPI00203F19FC|nr:peptide-methionine (S)-S-oxide reductase MsrA [Sporosarcina aquimarina]MCM3758170.1 peptide-methionine (S)-S-oxide reductase MsrA [Sporosarcina aquimarina]
MKQFATFAGGCFWCMVKPFDKYDGVLSVVSGYTGGDVPNPSYELVCSETTGHREAVQIEFDDEIISYRKLLDIFWRQIDPTDSGGQFFDRGESYETAIFYHSADQQKEAEQSKLQLELSGKFSKSIATEILPAKPFYLAEEGHQDYYKKNPVHYKRYSVGSGRERFKSENWSE